MTMLSEECQRFIVRALACSMPPSEVARAANTYFAAHISEQDVRLYDPTQDLSPDRITPYLIRLFAAARADYAAGLESWAKARAAGRATSGYRLALLQGALDTFYDGTDVSKFTPSQQWLALEILEEARKISNGEYEQSGDAAGDARMILLITLSKDVDELLEDYAADS